MTPNKQHGPASKASQATSASSFRDIFAHSTNGDPPSPSRKISPKRIASPNRLAAELQATQKELKRLKHKYEALYNAQEEILRRRNKDRDRWRHFKNVVKAATISRPDFQLELRKADALLKKQEEATLAGVAGSVATVDQSSVPSVLRDCTSTKQLTTVQTIRTPTKRSSTTVFEKSPTLSAQFRTPTWKPTTSRITHDETLPSRTNSSLPGFGTSARHPPTLATSKVSLLQVRPLTSQLLPTATPPPLPSDNPDINPPDPPQFVKWPSTGSALEIGSDLCYTPESSRREDWNLLDQEEEYLNEGAYAFLEEAFDMDERFKEAEALAVLDWERQNDMQILHRIIGQYEPASQALSPSETKWEIDGREIVGPPIPRDLSTRQTVEQVVQDEMMPPAESRSQPSTCDNLSFWSQDGDIAASNTESVPSEVEFGSYRPGTADSCCPRTKEDPTERSISDQVDEDLSVPEGPRRSSTKRRSRFFTEPPESASDGKGIPYLFPLPQDLQSGVPPDQDVLEESLPVRRVKRPRISASSAGLPSSIDQQATQEEKVWKPFESRSRRAASSHADSARASESGSTPRAFVSVADIPMGVSDAEHDDEATETSSSTASQEGAEVDGISRDLETHIAGSEAEEGLTRAETPSTAAPVPSTSTVKSLFNRPSDDFSTLSHPSFTRRASSELAEHRNDVVEDTEARQSRHPGAECKDDQASLPENRDQQEEERMPSYRTSLLADEKSQAALRRISNEKIGPRRPTSTTTSNAKPASTMQSREDFCERYLEKLVTGERYSGQHTQAPLGKPVVTIKHEDTPKGTPPAWHNMSSKRKAPSTGAEQNTPVNTASSRNIIKRQYPPGKISSDVVVIASTSALDHKTSDHKVKSLVEPARRTLAPSRTLSAMALDERESTGTPAPVGSFSHQRRTALQVVSGVRPTKKKVRKSGIVPDPDVQSDLDLIGAVILEGSSFVLGAKRPGRSRLAGEVHRDKEASESEFPPIGNVVACDGSKKQSDGTGVRSSGKATAYQRSRSMRDYPQDMTDGHGKAAPLPKKERNESDGMQLAHKTENPNDCVIEAKVKPEDREDSAIFEESEEFEGQNFLRRIHHARRTDMLANPMKHKGRGAYAAHMYVTF